MRSEYLSCERWSAITQQVYAHLHPDAFAEDYSRVVFAMPEKAGVVVKLRA